ncbi:hypothetical protein BGZ96_001694 [Linnemannia gamsii]|uniref:BTB domain-containing protein n=1 Tax=Linnemannia gamsii TaxID=64522 RepID=A0ABQ7JM70_9FUNG|nr:hypothetical protein BGZ96_001694 [Linnemannia gamsii]
MFDLSTVYKELLASDEGDIRVKLKDGKQLNIISFLIKNRSPIFKTMLESSMQEPATGVVDLSSQYSLEAFREFMAHIYYNKQYTGSYVPLLFEILCITDYYVVEAYKSYISDRIIKLITNVPVCLTIAFEALKHGTLTSEIYAKCLGFLVEAVKPRKHICYDEDSEDSKAWCCSDHSKKNKESPRSYRDFDYGSYPDGYTVNGQVACIESTLRKKHGYGVGQVGGYTQRCCTHGPKRTAPTLVNISDLPDFIVDDVTSAKK